MRKEIFFALLAGIAFGLVIALGIWKTNSNRELTEEQKENDIQTKQLTDFKLSDTEGITILKPDEYEVTNNNTINIEGITEKGAQIAISSEDKDFLINSDKNGGFKIDIPLIGGLNEIIITSFSKDGKETSLKLPVIYSKDFQE